MKKILNLLIIISIIAFASCQKKENNRQNNFEIFGKYHNKYIKDILLQKGYNNLEIGYNQICLNAQQDFNLNSSTFLPYDSILNLYKTSIDSNNTIKKLVYLNCLNFSEIQKIFLNELNDIIFLETNHNSFDSKIVNFVNIVEQNNSLTDKEKEIILISAYVAKYSKELWKEYYNNVPDEAFPWGIVGADVGGIIIGIWVTGGNIGYTALISAFFSLAYWHFDNI